MRYLIGALLLYAVLPQVSAMADAPALPEYYAAPHTPPAVTTGADRYALDGTGPSDTLTTISVHDDPLFAFFRADRLEYRYSGGGGLLWDVDAWAGGGIHKLFFESEGTLDGSELEDVKLELLYTRAATAFWDIQAGVRHDVIPGLRNRTYAAFGVRGMAPYHFEVDATLYLSDRGALSAIAEAEYDILLTQRMVLQPRMETEIALQSVPAYNIGAGPNKLEAGLRLRYEIRREFAPYIGVSWERYLLETARMVTEDGGQASEGFFVVGVRLLF